MNFPNIITSPCIPTTPPAPDPRCGDPIFALLHPDICASSPFLRIKPGVLLSCVLGSVQFQAFTVQNGIETLLETGVVWTVSDPTVALIGVTSGNATGISSGSVTVTAVSQGLTANATLTVLPGLNCCDTNDVATMLVVDKSHSMSLQFGGAYATKQSFADYVASQYAIQTNTQKDRIGLIEFDDTPTTDSTITTDSATVSLQAGAIVNSVLKTGIGKALQAAVDALALVTATTKVIVLISDGEDKDVTPANDPVPIATAFKTAGGILFTIGVRAHGGAFNLLNAMSTGGFFVNTYPSIVAQSLTWIYGLKGYLCAGNCAAPGNTYVNTPQLDYSDFTNWDVAGKVDLLGPGLFDVLPGNGLYVSLASNQSPWSGSLTSKTSFLFTAGKTYRLSFYLAGNQRQDQGVQTVTAHIGDGSAFQQVIIIPNYGQDFVKYSFNFTPLVTITAPIVVSQVGDDTLGNYYGSLFNRVTLEDITDLTLMFEDTFDGENLQFVPSACGVSSVLTGGTGIPAIDAPLVSTSQSWRLGAPKITPSIAGDVYAYAVSFENGVGETTLSAIQTVTIGTGPPVPNVVGIGPLSIMSVPASVTNVNIWRQETIGPSTRFYLLATVLRGTWVSGSVEDTETHAQFQARLTSSPNPPTSNTTGVTGYGYAYFYGYNCYGYGCLAEPPGVQLQDPNLLPDIESDYVPPTTYTATKSFTALCPSGTVQKTIAESQPVQGTNVVFPGSEFSGGYSPTLTVAGFNVTPTVTSTGNVIVALQGSNDNSNWTTLFQSDPFPAVGGTVYQFLVPSPGPYIYYKSILGVQNSAGNAAGTYQFDLLTATGSGGITMSATATSIISQADANNKALAAATLAANTALAVVGCATVYTSTQTATVKCTAGQYDGNGGQGSTASSTQISFVSQAQADALALAAATALAQSNLSCNQSNNTQAVIVSSAAPIPNAIISGSPYPSVAYISGLAGGITRIRANIIGLRIPDTEGFTHLLLLSPTGKAVELMRRCGDVSNLPTAINIVFDSNSVTALPLSGVFVAGSYRPTQYNAAIVWNPPAPQSGYLSDFTTLIGDNPNGSWSLWMISNPGSGVPYSAYLDGGWTLTIDV